MGLVFIDDVEEGVGELQIGWLNFSVEGFLGTYVLATDILLSSMMKNSLGL